jgi:hypothetical protein
MTNLSKSRIQNGRQCHKRLWLDIHDRDVADWGSVAQARLDEGTLFGELARKLLGRGVLIEAGHMEVREALEQTASVLAKPRAQAPILYEPAFSHEGVRVRVDALRRGPASDTLIEVKSSTQVKSEYIWDCAIQTWVVRGAGRNVSRVKLGLVDSSFVYTTPGDYKGLLKQVDITADVEALLPSIPGLARTLHAVADGPMPAIARGAHCHQPYDCPYIDHCRAGEPPEAEFPVALLPNTGASLAESLLAAGYRDVRDIPDGYLSSARHQRILDVTRSGRPFVSPDLVRLLEGLPYPRFYLDFETIAYIVPRWLGTRPFQQVPFQFSCHIERREGSMHQEAFLNVTGTPPMLGFVEKLLRVVKKRGPILVWSKGFEATRLRELAELFPEHAGELLAVVGRMVDLLPIYREHYYHRDMRGSWSIKAVLPTVAPELDYGDLAIANGGGAQEAFRRAVDPTLPLSDREEIARQLLAYCERDTLAMTRLTRLPKRQPARKGSAVTARQSTNSPSTARSRKSPGT